MHRERLEKLHELLDTILPSDFTLDSWATPRSAEDVGASFAAPRTAEPSQEPCGTVACACGWAALDPWFQAQGLRLVQDLTLNLNPDRRVIYSPEQVSIISLDRGCIGTQPSFPIIEFAGRRHHDAVRAFFGIEDDHSDALFMNEWYPDRRPGPEDVRERIRELLDTGTLAVVEEYRRANAWTPDEES